MTSSCSALKAIRQAKVKRFLPLSRTVATMLSVRATETCSSNLPLFSPATHRSIGIVSQHCNDVRRLLEPTLDGEPDVQCGGSRA